MPCNGLANTGLPDDVIDTLHTWTSCGIGRNSIFSRPAVEIDKSASRR